jgi:predicted nucleic acid-binding Zn ribbon protein
VGEEMKKIKYCLHCGKEIKPNPGSIQAHRQMYCDLLCKDAASHARRRLRAKGLLPPYETRVKKLVTAECKICGKLFEARDERASYCSDTCREEGRRRVKRASNWQTRIDASKLGEYGLAVDPWATGQLPESVRRNALWA